MGVETAPAIARALVVHGRAPDTPVAVVVEGTTGRERTLRTTLADLAADLELPLLVVARPGLGTLNHTRLTCEAAWARGLRVLGIVVNGYPSSPGIAEMTNLDGLAAIAPVFAVVPQHRAGEVLPTLPGLLE